MFPGAQRMNRGNHEIVALVRACKANNVTDLVIVHETRGQPGTPVCFRQSASSPSCVYTYYRNHMKQPPTMMHFYFVLHTNSKHVFGCVDYYENLYIVCTVYNQDVVYGTVYTV